MPAAFVIETVAISEIILDPELQPRVERVPQLIHEYARAIRGGAKFPPVVCYRVEGKLLLSDGWHRLGARQRIKETSIEVEIREGTRDDAIRHSREYNAVHGHRFTTEDKKRAVLTYLRHPIFSEWPDREIARLLNVDHKTVGKHRADLAAARRARRTAPPQISAARGISPAMPPTRASRAPAPVAAPVSAPAAAHPRATRRGISPEGPPPEWLRQSNTQVAIANITQALGDVAIAGCADQAVEVIAHWWRALTGGGVATFERPERTQT